MATAPTQLNRPNDVLGARRLPWLLVAPMVLVLLAFAVYPFIYVAILSASKSMLGKPFQAWIGFGNYQAAFNDDIFIASLLRSVWFAIPVTIVELVLGLGIALLLQGSLRGGHVVRTLILLPLMTPPIVVAVAWKLIFSPAGGFINSVLLGAGLIDKPMSFLGSSTWAFPSVALADAWQWTSFVALLAAAALLSLPEEVRQAALIDGASPWRAFWDTTLPMLAPALVAIALLRLIMAFKLFDLVYSLTQGGPGFDTTVASFNIYKTGLEQFNVGYAAAQTVIFGIMVGVITLPVMLLRDWALNKWA